MSQLTTGPGSPLSQLEIPQISIARYLDLLKRRRWQVLPVSIIGLLIGGIVAFFIPRYYVCTTRVQFQGPVLDRGPGADPMMKLVGQAELSIEMAAEEVLAKLGWPEATSGSEADRRAFIDAVKDEIKVKDLGPKAKGRTVANVEISYRDTDGARAEEFTEELRKTWIERQKKLLTNKADSELNDVLVRISMAIKALESAEADKQAFEKANDLNPTDFLGNNQNLLSAETLDRQKLENAIDMLVAAEAAKKKAIAVGKERLAKIPPWDLRPTANAMPPGLQKQLEQQIASAFASLSYITIALSKITPSHPDYARLKQDELGAQAIFAQLQQGAVGTEMETVPNANHTKAQNELDEAEIDLASIQTQLKVLRGKLQARKTQIKNLQQILPVYQTKRRVYAQADLEVRRLEMEQLGMEQKKRNLTLSEPYTVTQSARTPPRPTEPNITLVALAGMAIGLGLAIGLVLLVDVVQTTFKTVDDVERLLPLPVLGGMSHMVTSEQQRAVVVRRTRTGLVAGLFLALMVSLITIYYVAPTRLPPVVRDTLGLILGTPTPNTAPK